MPSEPSWSKKISSASVCTWFYALAIVNLLFGAAGILSGLYLMTKISNYRLADLSVVTIAAIVGFTNSWFLFLVCNRGIKA